MKYYRGLIYIIIGLLISESIYSQQNRLPFISVEGNKFINENGEVVIFRGVSVSDPANLDTLGKWDSELFNVLKEWNVNLVRFPIHPSAWRKLGKKKYLNLLDQGIKLAEEVGIYVIIDWHSIGNLRSELFYNDSYNTTKTETFRFWKTIAERYQNNSTIAFYELFNEPTAFNGKLGRITWQEHKNLMEELIEIIYAHDTTVIPLVAGFEWAYRLNEVEFEPIAYPNVAYVSHPYPQKREKPWIEKWEREWGFVSDRYPLIATEMGFMKADGPGAHSPVIVEDLDYGNTIIEYFNRKGISWVVWVFDPLWSPQLIKNWDYKPTWQGEFFKSKMIELNK